MRNGVLVAILALFAGWYLDANSDLAAALLAAKNGEERAAIMRGHDRAELSAAMEAVEKSGGADYARKDYTAALSAYGAAIDLARETGAERKLPFYFRRVGICTALLGHTVESIAVYREGVAASEKAGDENMLAENLHGLANNLQRLGQYREALPVIERENAIVAKAEDTDGLYRNLVTYAQILGGMGNLKQALPMQERAVEYARRSTNPTYYPAALANLGMAYGDLGDYETSLRILKTIANPTPNDLGAIAVDQKRLHLEAEAEVSYKAALAAQTAPVQWRVRAETLLNYAILQAQHGKVADARAGVEEALAISTAHQDPGGGSQALASLAELAIEQNRPGEAMEKAQEALGAARGSDSPVHLTDALLALGRAQELSKRDAEAERTFAEAVSVAEGMRADAPASAAGLQGEIEQWIPAYQFAVAHQIRVGNVMAALRLADQAKARVLLDMIDGGRPGLDALADPTERTEEEQVRTGVAKARRAALTKGDASSKAALEAAERKADDFDIRLYSRHPELVLQRAAPAELRTEDLMALANRRTALASYFTLADSTVLFVVRGGDGGGAPAVKMYQLPRTDKLESLIRSFRTQIAARDLDYRTSAKALYKALVAPAEEALAGSDRWIISPDGALWDVPFQALMDGQGKHVLETHALSYAPSLAVLRELQEKPAGESPRLALLAVANPAAGVAPIPESEREANAIRALYGPSQSTLLARERASAGLFRESASDARVIHLALHAETETNRPLESSLLFAADRPAGAKDAAGEVGALTARDLLGMRLHANLVVLSACETARGKIGQGDGVMGLGWAVLAAGARSSVLSQWKVDSGATSDLMIDFHRRLLLAKAADKAEALRQASLATMRSPNRLHPFYWAGFIVVGDAR